MVKIEGCKMSDTYQDVIIGAGVAGIVAALLQAKKGRKVLLVEQSDCAGGLLKSFKSDKYVFDYGTHLLSETGLKELDDIIIKDTVENGWNQFDFLKSGHFVNGTLCEKTPVIDSKTLKPEDLMLGAYEFINAANDRKSKYKNLAEQLTSYFGSTFSQKLMIPAVEKLFHTSADLLCQNTHHLFGLSRIQSFNNNSTALLKKVPNFDDVLAFQSHKDGQTGIKYYYPCEGRINLWVESLLKKFAALGGEIRYGQTVSNIRCFKERISSLDVNEVQVKLDKLIWTAPVFFLTRQLALNTGDNSTPLNFLNTFLVHLVVDQAPKTKLFYYTNYQPEFKHFRATLYSNLQQGIFSKGKHHVTVEVFAKSGELNCPLSVAETMQELFKCNILEQSTNVIHSDIQLIKNSFPVLTNQFMLQQKEQVSFIKHNVKNVELFGKARGDIFFMNDVLKDIFLKLN